MTLIIFIIIAIAAYLLGAVPFGLLYSKIRGVNIREVGSGNIGATNVAREFGFWGGFLPIFLLDAIKGAAGVLVVRFVGVEGIAWLGVELAMIIVGVMAVLGHLFPVYLKFKGGKGVATSAGVFLSLAPIHTLIVLGVFVILYLITKKVAIGSIVAAVVFPLTVAFFKPPIETLGVYTLVLSSLVAVLIVVSHRSNIKKMFNGEKKIEENKK